MFGLSAIKAALVAAAISAVLSGIGTGIVVHKLDNNRYLTLQRDYATAETRAITAAKNLQAEQDKVVLAAAVAEAAAQIKIVTRISVVKQEVPRYVPKVIPCVTVGLVRVLDAAVLGVAPDQLPLAAGQSDDTCTAFGADDLASAVVSNYGLAAGNAEQLNALSAAVRAIHEAKPARASGP